MINTTGMKGDVLKAAGELNAWLANNHPTYLALKAEHERLMENLLRARLEPKPDDPREKYHPSTPNHVCSGGLQSCPGDPLPGGAWW